MAPNLLIGDSDRALEALRRSLVVARDSGNRLYETQFSYWLAGREAEHGNRAMALEYLAVAIRRQHESGNIGLLHVPLAIPATFWTGSAATNRGPPS